VKTGGLLVLLGTAGGLSRRYEGTEALALREALQAPCCHSTSEEMWAR
jgi:hypothetical protein